MAKSDKKRTLATGDGMVTEKSSPRPKAQATLKTKTHCPKEVPSEDLTSISVKVFCEKVTKAPRAMKTIPKHLCKNTNIPIETGMNLLESLDHPNIPRIYELDQDNKNYYLVTEYCAGGLLLDTLASMRSFSEYEAAVIMKQILSAIAYCHGKGLAHMYSFTTP